MKHKKKNRTLFICIYVFLSLIALFSLVMIGKELYESYKSKSEFDDLSNIFWGEDVPSTESDNLESTDNNEPINPDQNINLDNTPDLLPEEDDDNSGQAPTVNKPVEPALKRDLNKLMQINPDCVGWIYTSGTKLNYPVMYTPNSPQKYLRRSFYGNKTVEGVPYIDEYCTLTGGHVIIYGHNMNNGTMFGSIKKYKKQNYFKQHPTIELETKATGVKNYKVFAVCLVKDDDLIYSVNNFENEENFNEFVQTYKQMSYYDTGVNPVYGKQIITLSTCDSSADTNRIVVLATEI